jgi:DNA invertase Pin-like site-specific DNA recombinase
MKVGIYARVSTKDQNTETQLMPIRDYCQRNEFEVLREYVDEGESGSKSSRPELNNLLNDMRERKFDTVVCYKLDRLGRSLSNLLHLLQEFKNRGIRLISVVDGLDTANDNPMSRAFWQLLGVFAELEREMIVARVNDGLDRAKKNGKSLGRPAGAKDKKRRRLSGYHVRWAKEKGEKK